MRQTLACGPTTPSSRRFPVADTCKHPSALGTHGRAVSLGSAGGVSPRAAEAVRVMPEPPEGVIDDYLAHKSPPAARPPVAPWSASYPNAINGDAMQEYTQGDPAAAA
jgi:hypothetical protein